MNTSPGPTANEPIAVDRKELLEAIDASFSLEELSTLCFALDVDIDNLGGAGKKGKARELIEYCLRSSRVHELLALCKDERPEVDWDAFVRIGDTQEAPDGASSGGAGRPEGEAKQKSPGAASRKRILLAIGAVAIVGILALVIWRSGNLSTDDDKRSTLVPAVRFRESALEVDESQEVAEFTVELNGSRTDTVTIPYETNDISATAGEDYEAAQGVLTFSPEEDTKTIAIPILRDTLDGEEDESLRLVLTDLQDQPVAATLTIRDHPSPDAGLRVGDLEVDESQGTAEFEVELAGSWATAVTVLYETSGMTAVAGDDFKEIGGALLFNPGENAKTISVPLILDWLGGEGDETVGLVFRNDPDSDVELPGLPVTATLTIKDHPPPTATFAENAIVVDESQNSAEFTLRLVGSWPDTVSISYVSSGGTATAGDDYEETRGVLTFSSGEGTQTIRIPVILDALAGEGDETVRLVLRNDPNSDSRLPGLPVTATLTIKDHPPPTARFASNALEVDESQEMAEIVVELVGSWPGPVSVPYETAAVTATAGDDYGETRDELTFNPGESTKTIAIPINNDSRRELDEKLNLALGDAPFVMVDGDSSTIVVTIKDDGDIESACSLPADERITPNQELVTLGFKAVGLFLRRVPSSTDESNIIKVVDKDEVLCVLDRNEGWYRVRLTDTVTDGWIGMEFAYTIALPRLRFLSGTAGIPFWDADSEPACQHGNATGIVGDVREVDILQINDRNSDGSCFKVQLTIDGRVGWIQSNSLDTTSAAGVEFDNILNSLWLRTVPDGDIIAAVRQEQILWASASGLDARCDNWYRVRLKGGGEGWLGEDRLIVSEALERLPREINLCEIDSILGND